MPDPGDMTDQKDARNSDAATSLLLPDSIPERWLCQIRESVTADRPNLLWSILGNSAVAALIAAAASISATFITIKGQGDVEIKKAQIAFKEEETKAARSAYNHLDQNLRVLLQGFDGVATLIDIDRKNHQLNSSSSRGFNAEFARLGILEGGIIEMKTDPHIDPKVWEQVDKPLNEITNAISITEPSYTAFSSKVKSIDADMGHAIEEVRRVKASLR
jgi:hypothetical protein